MWRACINECACCRHYLKGIPKTFLIFYFGEELKVRLKQEHRFLEMP